MNDAAILIHLVSGYAVDNQHQITDDLIELFAKKTQAFASRIYFCSENNYFAESLPRFLPQAILLPAQSEITALRHIYTNDTVRHIAVANGIYPLLDLIQTEKLFSIHDEYRADFSYAENLPTGIALNFSSRDILESIDIMEAKDAAIALTGMRAFVEKNINQFHAEVHYEEPDLRLLRLDFSLASQRSLVKTRALIPLVKDANAPYAELKDILNNKPELLHSFPSYIELEFSSTTKHLSYFSPLGCIEQKPHRLDVTVFNKTLEYIATGFGDTSVCASGLGEPLEHPDALQYITQLLEQPTVRYVFVETNGIHLDTLLPLVQHKNVGKLRVIVMLNSLERFTEFTNAAAAVLEKIKINIATFTHALTDATRSAQEIVYLQVLKVEENETEIDALFALSEDLGASFLLQKYNRYAELMPERRVSNMTPLERYSCWHLRRDLFIRANGNVAYCKQTIDQTKNSSRGNVHDKALAEIWAAQREDFKLNYLEKYPIHLPCLKCDEYFTFNF